MVALVLVIVAFLAGLALGAAHDPTVDLEVVEVEVPTGHFEDVPLTMRTETGATARYRCDMIFTPTGDTAACTWQDL